MHPIIEEICRAKLPIRPDVFRRWQRALREQIQPALDEHERLMEQNTPKAAKVPA